MPTAIFYHILTQYISVSNFGILHHSVPCRYTLNIKITRPLQSETKIFANFCLNELSPCHHFFSSDVIVNINICPTNWPELESAAVKETDIDARIDLLTGLCV